MTAALQFPRSVPAAEWQTGVTTHRPGWLRPFLVRATHFSTSLYGFQVTSDPGAARRVRIAEAVMLLLPVEVHEFYAATRWLGTTRRGALVLLGKLHPDLRARLLGQETPFPFLGPWEDVALYSADGSGRPQVLAWTTTHEQVGAAFSSDVDLRRLGFAPVRATMPAITAERLSQEAESDILATVTRCQGPREDTK